MARTSRVVVDGGVVVVAFGVEEKEDRTVDRDDEVGSYCDASEGVCGCTLASYQTLTQNRIRLVSVAVFVIVMIAVAIQL